MNGFLGGCFLQHSDTSARTIYQNNKINLKTYLHQATNVTEGKTVPPSEFMRIYSLQHLNTSALTTLFTAGKRRQNDVVWTLKRRQNVKIASKQRRSNVVCELGYNSKQNGVFVALKVVTKIGTVDTLLNVCTIRNTKYFQMFQREVFTNDVIWTLKRHRTVLSKKGNIT